MTSGIIVESVSSALIEEATSWRHHLHEHPELAFEERHTADFVASQLDAWGLKVHRGLAGTGVVGTLTRGMGQRAIAIRADMDGLSIQEESGAAYSSRRPGIMHACGHDGHVAMALAAARACSEMPDLDGTVHFIFQPAEENEAGGRRMVEDGLFRLFPCDAVYGLHNWPALPLGTFVARDGPMMAAFGIFEIAIHGRGCHGAMPNEGADCILAGCHLVTALQSIVSRNVRPIDAAVVSVTQVHAGSTWNVIPPNCIVRGTTRWFEGEVGDVLERRVTELAKAVSTAFGCEAHVRYERRYPATINNPAAASLVRAVGVAPPVNLRLVDAQPSLGAEDFAFMLLDVPGCYIWLGAGGAGDNRGLHSPYYDFNDELLPFGVGLWTSLVRHSLFHT